MLVVGCFAVALTVGIASPDPDGLLAVSPLSVDGPLPEELGREASRRIATAVGRGGLRVVAVPEARDCDTPTCYGAMAKSTGAEFVLVPALAVADDQRGYTFTGAVYGRDGQEAFVLEAACDLCGLEEALDIIEDRVATTGSTIERLRAKTTRVHVTGTPAGAQVSIDGSIVGTVPVTAAIEAGTHRVEVRKPGYLPQSLDVDLPPGAKKSMEIRLVADPGGPGSRRSRRLTIAGATLTGLSVLSIGAGAALVGVHGQPYRRRCDADGDGDCRFLLGTRPGGIAALVAGAVTLGVGVALLVIGTRRRRANRSSRRYSPSRLRSRWSLAVAF